MDTMFMSAAKAQARSIEAKDAYAVCRLAIETNRIQVLLKVGNALDIARLSTQDKTASEMA
jgi:hypothetical protein